MKLIEKKKNRRSVNKYKNQKIEREKIERLKQAALLAPTSKNKKGWESNFVENKDTKNDYIREAAKQIPIMLINGAMTGENIYSILCDDFQAIYEATSRFLKS